MFRAADALLVPVIPTTLSIRTFDQLDRFVETNPEVVEELEVIGFFSMVDRRKRLHRELVIELRKARPDLLDASHPVGHRHRAHGRAPPAGGRVLAAVSRAARSYAALWDEILTRL